MQAKSINYYAEYYPENILQSLRVIHQIDGALSDARRLEQQHILTDDDKEKKSLSTRIVKARADLQQRLKDYEPLVADDQDRALLNDVGHAVAPRAAPRSA